MLTGKGVIAKRQDQEIVIAIYGNKKGKGIVRAGYGNKIDF